MARVGRVYLIFNDLDDMMYVGSTEKELEEREYLRVCSMRYEAYKDHNCKVNRHYRAIGMEHLKMVQLEEVRFDDKDELRWAERRWLERYRDELGHEMLNELCPIRSAEESAAYKSAWKLAHKDDAHIRAREAAYRKTAASYESQKRYRDSHKASEAARHAAYSAQRWTCPECGKEISKAKKSRHLKTHAVNRPDTVKKTPQ